LQVNFAPAFARTLAKGNSEPENQNESRLPNTQNPLLNFLRHFIRRVGTLPPEPLPDVAQIPRDGLSPIVRELASKDRRFVVLISLDQEKIFRGHSFTWFTHADDVWSAFWTRHDFGIITDDCSIVVGEAERQIQTFEKACHFLVG
jgi:hypothetical protein